MFITYIGSSRKRRSTEDNRNTTRYYIEAVDPVNVRTIYTYVKFIPYNTGNQYNAVDASELCPLFENTDIRCVNDQDCKILETVGIKCYHEFGKTGTDPAENSGGSSTPNYIYIIVAVIIMALISVIIMFLFVKRFRRRVSCYEFYL